MKTPKTVRGGPVIWATNALRAAAFGINMTAAVVGLTVIFAAEAVRESIPLREVHANCARRLRQLLLQIYAAGVLTPKDASPAEEARLYDIVLAAGEGRPFAELGLPYPRTQAHQIS